MDFCFLYNRYIDPCVENGKFYLFETKCPMNNRTLFIHYYDLLIWLIKQLAFRNNFTL